MIAFDTEHDMFSWYRQVLKISKISYTIYICELPSVGRWLWHRNQSLSTHTKRRWFVNLYYVHAQCENPSCVDASEKA